VPDRGRTLNREIAKWTFHSNKDMLSHMKRTTLVLDPALYAALKRRAAAEGRTLTDVIEGVLRSGLRAEPRRPRVALPSYDLGPFLIDPADRAAVAEATARRAPLERER
jgi:hypothetical protein